MEIEAPCHGAGWTPRRSFEEDVRLFGPGPAWVTRAVHSVHALLAERADLLFRLDLPRAEVMRQVVRPWTVRVLSTGRGVGPWADPQRTVDA